LTANKLSTVLNIVTTYAWTGSAYVVPSATAKAGVLATEVLLNGQNMDHHTRNYLDLSLLKEHGTD
jgi:hypothetical protein